jgi:carotenoid cleavage dioxygenase
VQELDQSEMLVLDAKTMSSTPLASVKLPQRVPYGFHASFVEEKLLQAQVSL